MGFRAVWEVEDAPPSGMRRRALNMLASLSPNKRSLFDMYSVRRIEGEGALGRLLSLAALGALKKDWSWCSASLLPMWQQGGPWTPLVWQLSRWEGFDQNPSLYCHGISR